MTHSYGGRLISRHCKYNYALGRLFRSQPDCFRLFPRPLTPSKEKDLFGISLARVNVSLLRYATSAADLHLLAGAVLRASVLCNLEFGYTSILGHYVQKYRNNLSKIIVRLSALSFTTTTTSKA